MVEWLRQCPTNVIEVTNPKMIWKLLENKSTCITFCVEKSWMLICQLRYIGLWRPTTRSWEQRNARKIERERRAIWAQTFTKYYIKLTDDWREISCMKEFRYINLSIHFLNYEDVYFQTYILRQFELIYVYAFECKKNQSLGIIDIIC